MNYRFILTYKPTDSETTATRTCFPLHGDDLSISIDREQDEWYYTRKLDGKLVFERGDYAWIMDREFDGTFTLDIKESHDNGATWFDYFTGTFSRANLEIDQDNQTATLNGLSEGIPDLIKNGAKEDYDLMKLIPDSEAKEVQGQVPPALAMVDYRSTSIDKSDIFCGGAATAGGYDSKHSDSGFNVGERVTSDDSWNFRGVFAEAQMKNDPVTNANGLYAGTLSYNPGPDPGIEYYLSGTLYGPNGYYMVMGWSYIEVAGHDVKRRSLILYDSNDIEIEMKIIGYSTDLHDNVSPSSLIFGTVTVYLHYIRATLLTQSADGVQENVLDTGDYYKGMSAFEGSGLQVTITTNTSEQPNGHRMVPGSDEYGGTPQYFAPPDTTQNWIPLAEDNWNFASMWYTIEPSVANGLDDPEKYGTFRWTRCWTIGCCINALLKRITNGKVTFTESATYSQFLYGNPNPVQGNEPFQWLVTQKSNVMSPAATGAARCIVRLDWFLELLRNAFNCYYWFEKINGTNYNFHIEHVEYFRHGGAYSGQLANQLDLTRLKPIRNFLRNNMPAKRYADGTNKYTFDLDGMVEKYTYSWQGEGGGDDFRGNPMYFKAGWIEKGSSEDRQVDNIFADLGWLMLNAGTDTASSKNYDGLFIFGGYQPMMPDGWKENSAPLAEWLTFAIGIRPVQCELYVTAPAGQQMGINTGSQMVQVLGTGSMQRIAMTGVSFDFGANYTDVIIHRIHSGSGNTYYVPNVRNLLRTDVVNYLQNGVLAWPWLQKEYLHYDIPAAKWTYLKDDYTDNPNLVWESDGTIKMVKKQSVGVVPVPDASTEEAIMDIMGIKTGLGIGIIDSAKINLSSRNAEMTIIYDINPQNN